MASTRRTLAGRTGWSTVLGLSTVLTVLVAGQLPAASAENAPLAPVASALGLLVPSLAPSPARAAALPTDTDLPAHRVAAPVRPAVAPRAATSAARPAPARPAAQPAKPAGQPAPQAAPQAAAKPAAAPGLCSGAGWQQRRGQAAMDSLRPGAVGRTGFRVEFKGARTGFLGLTHLQERRIEMFVRGCGTQSDELLRHVMAHELGHAYDTVRMNAATRRAYQLARGIPLSTPWYGCSSCADFATPAGDFAEVYAQWARGASSNRSQLAGDVPAGRLAALASQFFGA